MCVYIKKIFLVVQLENSEYFLDSVLQMNFIVVF